MDLMFPLAVGGFFGLLTPLLFIFLNHETRVKHIRLILAIRDSFGSDNQTKRAANRSAIDDTPSFNMVLSKYFADIGDQEKYTTRHKKHDDHCNQTIQITSTKPFNKSFLLTRSNYALFLTSIPYCIAVTFFFFVTLTPHLLDDTRDRIFLTYSELAPFTTVVATVANCSPTGPCSNVTVLFSVITFSFLGAYIFTLAYLLRSVSMFDLDGRLFFQSFRQIVGSVIGATVVWRFGLALPFFGTSINPEIWSLIAFIIGFLPDGSIRYLFTALSSIEWAKPFTRFYKANDDRFSSITKSIPLDVIDGIDTYTRFRLEVNGIYEVQNLATANAILLHVETPYGLYQTIDWVAQAQLCTIVGPERFLAFRQFNIRTIFDLERATLGLRSTSQLRRIIGAILTSPTQTIVDLQTLTGSKFYTFAHTDAPQDPARAAAATTPLEAFLLWVRDLIGQPARVRQVYREQPANANPAGEAPQQPGGQDGDAPPCTCGQCAKCESVLSRLTLSCFKPSAFPEGSTQLKFETTCGPSATLNVWEAEDPEGTIKHIVRVIVDDLHVQRLRQIWESISRQLDADSLTLDDSEDAIYG